MLSVYSRLFRSRYVVRVFLALVAYGAFTVFLEYSGITPQLTSVNVRYVNRTGESIRRNAVPLPSVKVPQLPSVNAIDVNRAGGFMRRSKVPLPPVRVFREWQYHHSVQAIKRNPHNRKFIVGRYSCPRQAGNFFHEHLSALLQAVATNRTFLSEYHQNAYWESMGENSEEACGRILRKASWIPSYNELNHTLKLDKLARMHHEPSET
jgi:hypothetical protein